MVCEESNCRLSRLRRGRVLGIPLAKISDAGVATKNQSRNMSRTAALSAEASIHRPRGVRSFVYLAEVPSAAGALLDSSGKRAAAHGPVALPFCRRHTRNPRDPGDGAAWRKLGVRVESGGERLWPSSCV